MNMEFFDIPLSILNKHVDPMAGELWGCDRICGEEVHAAVTENDLESNNWDAKKDDHHGLKGRTFHVRRIAYFVKNGLPVDEHSIQLFIGSASASGDGITINNGNHRISAAMVRNDETVRALVYYYEDRELNDILPGATRTK